MLHIHEASVSAEQGIQWRVELVNASVLRFRAQLGTEAVNQREELVLVSAATQSQRPINLSAKHIASTHLEAHYCGDNTWRICADNEALLALNGTTLSPAANAQDGYTMAQTFIELGDEAPSALYGLGQFPQGVINWRGHAQRLSQSNQGIAAPLLLSTRGYGILWNNLACTDFDSDNTRVRFSSDAGDGLDFFVLWGPSFDALIAHARTLTGSAPLFGRWAYGYWQSKERYIDANDIIQVAKRHRELNIPIDNLVQDWKYWGELGWSAMAFDKARYGDGAAMVKALKALNFQVMLSIWPVVGEGSDVFKALQQGGHLFETPHWAKGHIYDAFDERARDIYWQHVKRGLYDVGVDAFWMDGTEPEFISSQIPQTNIDACLAQRDTAAGSWRRVLNGYSLVTTGGMYQAQRALSDEKRVFTLSRSSFLGQQRYAAACWSGDISASWQVFAKQIAAGLNLSAASLPYWTTDIGGFFTTGEGASYPEGVDDDAYKELYVRWFQFGAFCPLFRAHGANTPREIYQFGCKGDWAFDALLKFDILRYRLLPYIYSQAWQVTQHGGSIMRLLAFDFPEQRALHNIHDQYLFGRAFMVCPVTKPMFHAQQQGFELVSAAWQQVLYRDDALQNAVSGSEITCIDSNWAGGPPAGLPLEGYSAAWECELLAPCDGDYHWLVHANDGVRFYLDGVCLIDSWRSQAASNHKTVAQLNAGQRVRLRLEYAHWQGSSKVNLSWAHAGLDFTPTKLSAPVRHVQLPSGTTWFDYWHKRRFAGGQNICLDTPIDSMPLLVRAGSIVPHGPDVQYHNEKPCELLRIEIYPEADGEFVLYEDEGDSYRYEQGHYSEIRFTWHDKTRTLHIASRQGQFAGMLAARRFNCVLVGHDLVQCCHYDGSAVNLTWD